MNKQMNNLEALNLLNEISELIRISKKTVYQIVDKEDTSKIVEIRELEPFLKLPVKIGYILLKNKNILLSMQKEHQKIIEDIQKEYLDSLKFDEAKYKTDTSYKKEIEESVQEYLANNEIIKSFLKDTFEKKLFPLKISVDKEEDKEIFCLKNEKDFDISYISDLIFQHILLFE